MPNFLTFLVDGGQHCFTPINTMYKTGPEGPRSENRPKTDDELPDLVSWLSGFPLSSGGSASTECAGETQGPGVGKRDGKNTYCETDVSPKQFVAA